VYAFAGCNMLAPSIHKFPAWMAFKERFTYTLGLGRSTRSEA